MEEKTKTVKVEVEEEYILSFVAKIICPYCHTQQYDCLDESEKSKTLLTACQSCDEDFYIEVPHFPILK